MTIRVILNPYSNRWTALKRRGELEAGLQAAGLTYDLVVSEHPGHITELAHQAVLDGCSHVLVAGGDGSIGETVNGLIRSGRPCEELPPLGVLPLGSANDMVFGLKIPLDLEQAARVIATGKTSRLDIGQVNDRYFANNSAAGIEPYITLVQQRIHWIKGASRYMVAAVRGIMDKPAWTASLEWEGGSYRGPLSLVTVGNGPRSGGFFMSPHADFFDGLLTVVHGYRKNRRGMLTLLPKAAQPGAGSYVESPGVHEFHTPWINVHLENPSPAHVDGEIFSKTICDLSYRILPGRIRILLP
jgi:diacylglycerol kinase (ATP)